MDLIPVIMIYAVFVFILAAVLYKCGFTVLASITLSLIICQIFLNLLKPPSETDSESEQPTSKVAFYITIQYLTPAFAFVVLFSYLLRDRRKIVSFLY
jgi:hypothetical protein